MVQGIMRFGLVGFFLLFWSIIAPASGDINLDQETARIYIIEIATTDTFRLPEAQSTVGFRLTVFGRLGEFGQFVPGGTDHQAVQKLTLAKQDIGMLHSVSIYTTHMADPWHVKTVTIIEEGSGRVFCFFFDKWVGWSNTIIWSSCSEDDCGCHWSDQEVYTVLLAGPIKTNLNVHLFGTLGEAFETMEAAEFGDAWEGWQLTNVGDIQKIAVNCTDKTSGPFHLRRVYVASGQDRVLRCFAFNRPICDPKDQSTFYVDRKCANVDCGCV